MTLAIEKLQSLEKAVANSTFLLKEQQKMMSHLKVEEKNAVLKINLWNELLPQKEKLLEHERKELVSATTDSRYSRRNPEIEFDPYTYRWR